MRLLAAVLLGAGLAAAAQISVNLSASPKGASPKPDVVSLVEPQWKEARKHQDVELIFQVRKGLHINSHKPGSSYLLPTELTLQPVEGMSVGKMHYDAGQSYAFSFAPKEKLEVYTDIFRIHVAVRAAKHGSYVLHGSLRYQSCDNAACFPPETVPVKVEIDAK